MNNFFLTLKVMYAVVANTISKYFYEDIYNSMNKHVVVPYEHNGIPYKILVKKIRNYPKIMFVFFVKENGEEEDITEQVKPFMGAFSNFHGIPTTPSDLGYDVIKFVYTNRSSIIFKKDELIQL